ncbi:MAG: DNA alkylation repair protein [Acidiferrobacterales bacterium]
MRRAAELSTNLAGIRRALKKLSNRQHAEVSQRFFKTAPGEYGAGDVFLGIRVPEIRKLARQYEQLRVTPVRKLLRSTIHEERLLALFILARQFARASETERKRIYEFYLRNTKFVNNWDLVDGSAEHIVGAYLADKSKAPLYRLARSQSMWERRIAIMSTFHFIKRSRFADTLRIAEMLLSDEKDLVHKAVGWMLREIGKRDLPSEEQFLQAHYAKMPRTMLRYAIERLPARKRQAYLKGTI